MRHGDKYCQQEWDRLQLDLTHNSFISVRRIEGAPIYRYGNKKIEQFNYLLNRGVNFWQVYLFDCILFSLSKNGDEVIQNIFHMHNPDVSLALVTLLEKEKKIHPLWIQLRTESIDIDIDCDVSRHMHVKLNLANCHTPPNSSVGRHQN